MNFIEKIKNVFDKFKYNEFIKNILFINANVDRKKYIYYINNNIDKINIYYKLLSDELFINNPFTQINLIKYFMFFYKDRSLILNYNNNDFIELFIQTFKINNNIFNKSIIENKYSYNLEKLSIVVYGCPLSTDIDIAVFIPNNFINSNNNIRELKLNELEYIKNLLKNLDYDITNKEIDIVLIHIKSSKDFLISKGGKIILNIISETWIYHNQIMNETNDLPLALFLNKYDLINYDNEIINNHKLAYNKFIVEYLHKIIDKNKYDIFKKLKIKQKLYENLENMENFIINFLNEYDNIIYNPDIFKSITIKLIQIITLYYEKNLKFTKMLMIEHIILCLKIQDFDIIEGIKYNLTRGNIGKFNINSFYFLHNEYIKILKYENDTKNIITYNYNIINHLDNTELNIDKIILNEFIKSPIKMNKIFELRWKELYNNININKLFSESSTVSKELEEYIPDNIRKHFIWDIPKSDSWLDKLNNKYKCGNNSGSKEDIYPLIRGSIIEHWIIELLDLNILNLYNFIKLSVGFIVEKDIINSIGCAPDLILISKDKNEIIPIEIKSLKCLTKNNSYLRAFSLAKRQINSVKNILNKYNVIKRGLVILGCINNNFLDIEIYFIDL
jgi:hypothetical protein